MDFQIALLLLHYRFVTCIDKQQQTPRYKRNDSYEEKKEYRNNLKRNNSESCKSDAKRKEKAGECKELRKRQGN